MSRGVRSYDEEQEAAVLERSVNPLEKSLRQIAEEEGVSPNVVKSILARARRNHPTFMRALGEVRKSDLRDKYLYLADQILDGVTAEDIAQAKLKDKMLSSAIAIDKAQLLDGLPTEIYSVKELENLDELSALLLKELDRRGLSARTNEATQQVTVLPDPEAGNRRDPKETAWAPSDEPR